MRLCSFSSFLKFLDHAPAGTFGPRFHLLSGAGIAGLERRAGGGIFQRDNLRADRKSPAFDEQGDRFATRDDRRGSHQMGREYRTTGDIGDRGETRQIGGFGERVLMLRGRHVNRFECRRVEALAAA